MATPALNFRLALQGLASCFELLGVNDFRSCMCLSVRAAFLVFMLQKSALQVGSDSRVETIVGALEDIDKVDHGFIVALRSPSLRSGRLKF